MDITLKNISKFYNKDVCAVRDFSLTFENGKLTSLLGPSGCGKTTVLNIISGIIEPTCGEVFFGNENVTHSSIRERNIGYVFQKYSLYPNMTVYENIRFPLTNIKYPKGFNKKEYFDEEIRKAADLLKIDGLLNRNSYELSGGQKQRVAIARALVRKPKILLMDEPFANLDKKLSVTMREDIRRIQQELGTTTVFVTHNQSDANAISDNIILMNDGVILQHGTGMELYKNPACLFVADFFGRHDINVFKGVCENGKFISRDIVVDLPGENNCDIKYLTFRPENVFVAEGDNCDISATVKSAVYEGDRFLYTLETESNRFFAYLNKSFSVDEKVNLVISKDGLMFFDSVKKRVNL